MATKEQVIQLNLNVKEFIVLANAMHDAKWSDGDWIASLKGKEYHKYRKIFEKQFEERHKVWLKITHDIWKFHTKNKIFKYPKHIHGLSKIRKEPEP